MKPREGRYLVTVDHLRALAALLIIFYHGLQLFGFLFRTGIEGFNPMPWPIAAQPLQALVIEGHSAVAMFMVLSGFIFANGNFGREVAFRPFMANRLWRIYPLFVFFTFFGYLIYPQNYSFFGALQALLPIAGLPGAAETDLTAVAWAIRVEFEFYLVFPFIHHFTRRFGLRYLFGVLALFVMLRFWAFEQTGRAQDLAYWTILGRMDQFVIGMLIAHAHQAFIARARLRQLLALPALGLLLAWMYWFNHSGGWPLNERHRVLWPLGDALAYGALIFTYLGFEELPRFRASLPVRWFAKLGEMSFSVYLMHYFVLKTLVHKAWVLHLVEDPDKNALLNTALVLLPVTVAFSVLTFNLIERPFFQFRKSYEPQPSR